MSTSIVFANRAAVTYVDGKRIRLVIDEPWRATDPVVKAHPEFFNDEPAFVNSTDEALVVEQATAAPGEKRATKRAAAKKSAAK